jgi:hypothetical protein
LGSPENIYFLSKRHGRTGTLDALEIGHIQWKTFDKEGRRKSRFEIDQF